MVHRLLQERLGQEAHAEVDPDLCVALGAAVQGAMIQGIDVSPVLVDITPHTLGIQAVGDLHGFVSNRCFVPIIERNTPLPASRSDLFGTVVDEQEQALITVFQGENRDVRHNEPVGEFRIEGLADVRRGNEILVRFDLDLDGILKVTARERATGLEKRLTIDNPVSRFRKRDRGEAPARAALAAGVGAGSGAVALATAGSAAGGISQETLSPEWNQKVLQSESLIAKAQQLAPNAHPEDREEIERLVEKLRRGIAAQSGEELAATLAELEDLVFYLKDA